jgi:hypothetical protein
VELLFKAWRINEVCFQARKQQKRLLTTVAFACHSFETRGISYRLPQTRSLRVISASGPPSFDLYAASVLHFEPPKNAVYKQRCLTLVWFQLIFFFVRTQPSKVDRQSTVSPSQNHESSLMLINSQNNQNSLKISTLSFIL